jgi:hypothetical protein
MPSSARSRSTPTTWTLLCGTMTLAADEGRRKDAEAVAVRLGPRAARCTRDDDNARPATVDAASVVRYGTGAKR